jgi:hypothetical protein
LAFQDFILLDNGFYQFIDFHICSVVRFAKREDKSSFISLEIPSSSEVVYLGMSLEYTFFFLPSLAMRHLWPMLGKRRPYLLMAMLAASSSEEESVESHSLPMCASPPLFLLLYFFFSIFFFPFLSLSLSLSLAYAHLAI